MFEVKMKKSIFGQFLILLTVGGIACSPTAQEKAGPNTELKFEPRLTDRELPWDKIAAKNPQFFFERNTDFVVSGDQVMNTFENLMNLGDLLRDPNLRQKGHDYVRAFYANRKNATIAEVKQSLYLEAALGEKRLVLIQLLKNKQEGLKNSVVPVQKTSDAVAGLARTVENLPLSAIAPFIQHLLDKYLELLQSNGAFKDVWRGFRREVDEKYRAPLLELGLALGQVSPDKSVQENVSYMRAVTRLPLDAKTIARVGDKLTFAESLATRVDKLDSSDEGVKIILDLWLTMSGEERKQKFGEISGALYWVLNQFSNAEIIFMRQNFPWGAKEIGVRKAFQAAIYLYGVDKVKNKIAEALQKSVVPQFEQELKKEILNLPKLILEKTKLTMEGNAKKIDGLLVGTNYRQFFVDLSVSWGQRELFGGKSTMLGMEGDRYHVTVSESGDVQFSPDRYVRPNTTTSGVLGASLSMSEQRFQRVTEFEGAAYDSPAYYSMVVEVLNKIPALGGFKKIDEAPYPSFHLLKGASDPFEPPLDIKTQTGSDHYYSVPDFIVLKPPFSMDRAGTVSNGVQFGVHNQAELLRGLSHMIEFFRDWRSNGFDVKMSQYKLGDLIPDLPPHLEKELLFPKEKLFEYCLGIGSIILENLQRSGSGLVLFGYDGKLRLGETLKTDEKAKESLMAALVDVNLKGRRDFVRSGDLARFILAMGKFVQAVEGFENTHSTLIQEETKGEKLLLNRLKKSIADVRVLMALFSNFLIHKMQRSDGAIEASYSLSRDQVDSRSRNLEDQALVIQALLLTGETLSMGTYLGSAYDTYFGMNHVFFDDTQAFYSSSDRAWVKPESYVLTEIMVALAKLSTKTDFSRGQIGRLLDQFRGQLLH